MKKCVIQHIPTKFIKNTFQRFNQLLNTYSKLNQLGCLKLTTDMKYYCSVCYIKNRIQPYEKVNYSIMTNFLLFLGFNKEGSDNYSWV